MDLRTYQPADKDGCLAAFDSNVPAFFQTPDRAAIEAFLDEPPGTFLVLDHDGVVAGCGGYTFEHPDLASIRWLMVRRDLHGNGLGRFLLFSAMRKLTAEGDPAMLRVTSTPAAAGFFEKQGFRSSAATTHLEMVKKLKVCP
ncbi:MAG TPA: GNAT family N-acetyltransferase [Bryobacteraceae bacterium]|nr:GNAT family N-acetyltransferase [Bryobacteraceae bacterium]